MAEPGRPVDNSAKRSAGRTEATTKMHEAAYTIPAHANRAPSTRLRTIFGAASAFTCTGGAARPLAAPCPRATAAPSPPQHTPRRGGGADPAVAIATRTHRAGRRARSPRTTTRPRNPIEARLLARERERKAKKPLTAKDLDNKMAEAEERRQLELGPSSSRARVPRPAPARAGPSTTARSDSPAAPPPAGPVLIYTPSPRKRERDRRVVRAVHRRRRSRVGTVHRRGVPAAKRARDDRHDLFRARAADARLAARELVGVVVLKRLLADAARRHRPRDNSARRRRRHHLGARRRRSRRWSRRRSRDKKVRAAVGRRQWSRTWYLYEQVVN